MAVLRLRQGFGPPRFFDVCEPQTVLGRHPDCQIILDHAAVSRRHARVICRDGEYFLEDLRSNNGTYLNGALVRGRSRLRDRDEVRVCDVVLSFHTEAPADHMEPGPSVAAPVADRTVADTDFEVLVGDQLPETAAGSAVMPLPVFSARLNVGADSSTLRLRRNPELKLRAVLQMTRTLSRMLDTGELLPRILDGLFEIFPQADTGAVLEFDARAGEPAVRSTKSRRGTAHVPTSRTVARYALQTGEAVLITDAAGDGRFSSSDSLTHSRIHSMMCVPLMAQSGESLGIVQIGIRHPQHAFTQDDLDVLVSMASQAGLALENARLHEALLRQRQETEESIQRLNLELCHASRLNVVGEMAAGVAHQLQQPLAAIVHYASGAERRLRFEPIDAAGLAAAMHEIASESLRAGEIIRSIRDFVQKRMSERHPVDVNAVVGDAVNLAGVVRRQHGAEIRLDLVEGLPPAFADRLHVTQVLLNLVVNAIEATAEAVTIATRPAADGQIEVAVADDGPGIPDDVREQIFEQFFTTKPDGLGIGLAISRSIIDAHGGRLWYASTSGRGATFYFALPPARTAED